jgi:hypothetical protein
MSYDFGFMSFGFARLSARKLFAGLVSGVDVLIRHRNSLGQAMLALALRASFLLRSLSSEEGTVVEKRGKYVIVVGLRFRI